MERHRPGRHFLAGAKVSLRMSLTVATVRSEGSFRHTVMRTSRTRP
ncbi:hypothetical protein [Streptomyces sp. NPDC057557]